MLGGRERPNCSGSLTHPQRTFSPRPLSPRSASLVHPLPSHVHALLRELTPQEQDQVLLLFKQTRGAAELGHLSRDEIAEMIRLDGVSGECLAGLHWEKVVGGQEGRGR